MHLFTGFLLSLLFANKQNKKIHPLLQLKWPVITKHILPGRVRFQIPLIAGKTKTLNDTVNKLSQIDGINQVQSTVITGTILIYFDQTKLQAELIVAALIRLLGLEKELEKVPVSSVGKEIKQFSKSLDQAIHAKTEGLLDLKTLVPVSLGLIGLFRLLSVRPVTLPSAITMIWWAYNSLTHKD